jgi:hypothetical protein
MTELPSGREIADAYNIELAEKLLNIANAEDKITAATFSVQLSNWAGTNLRVLNDELNLKTNPTTMATRTELKNVISAADKLNERLMSLSNDAAQSIHKQFVNNPEFNELQIMLDGQNVLNNIMLSLDALSSVSMAAFKTPRSENKGIKQRRTVVRKNCVGELAFAWVLLTGEMPTRLVHGPDHYKSGLPYGPFYDFAIMALEPIFGKTDSAQGIDDVIKVVIRDMGKNLDLFSCVYFHM